MNRITLIAVLCKIGLSQAKFRVDVKGSDGIKTSIELDKKTSGKSLSLKDRNITDIVELSYFGNITMSQNSKIAFLDLSGNRISALTNLTFVRIPSLTSLDLANNNISSLANVVFKGIRTSFL